MITKPTKIYHEEDEPELIEPKSDEWFSDFESMISPTPRKEEVKTIEPTPSIQETIINPEPEVEEKKPEPTSSIPVIEKKQEPLPFKFERPDGWNKKKKKTSIFVILVKGVLGKEMEPRHWHRYDNFRTNSLPILIIILLFLFGVVIFNFNKIPYLGSMSDKKKNGVDLVFDFMADKYDYITGRKTPEKKEEIISTKIVVVDSVKKKLDTIPKKDTFAISNWEKEYNKLDSSK